MTAHWMGDVPTHCDVSREPITDEFVDGATVYGPWAFMTPAAHKRVGRGLGTGKGQRYQRQDDGRWLKVEG